MIYHLYDNQRIMQFRDICYNVGVLIVGASAEARRNFEGGGQAKSCMEHKITSNFRFPQLIMVI